MIAMVVRATEREAVSATDAQDFEQFVASERGRLVKACLLLTGRVPEAEDLAQEALSRVLERWDEVRRMASPAGYLYRTALNLDRKRLRRLGVAARRRLAEREEGDELALADDRMDVRRALRVLPRQQREALVLVEWLGYSAEEAGSMLGIKAVSVRARLHRARNSLRSALGGAR
jgi:RNA polymerase sigma-70 factor (ECF subfamily)